MRRRDVAALALLVAAVPLAVWFSDVGQVETGVPSAVVGSVAAAVVLSWPRAKAWVAWPAAVAATVSLVATAVILAQGAHLGERSAGLVGVVEIAGLLGLLVLVARWAAGPTLVAVGAALWAAAVLYLVRFIPATSPLEYVGGLLLWSLGPATAVVVGGYPRLAAARLRRSVRQARLDQRLVLAQDVHDYVAHDVSGIVAQAQAARYVAGDDVAALRTALDRIEVMGQHALTAMDQMVAMLAEEDPSASLLPQARLTALPAIVDRFRSERPDARVELSADLPDGAETRLPAQVESTTFRVVVEALTNVRRHAPNATRVDVSVGLDADEVVARVWNDGVGTVPDRPARATDNRGLSSLRDRVHDLGGSFAAGPEAGGWQVSARMPVDGDAPSR